MIYWQDEEKKKKRKLRLEMADQQVFMDGDEVRERQHNM